MAVKKLNATFFVSFQKKKTKTTHFFLTSQLWSASCLIFLAAMEVLQSSPAGLGHCAWPSWCMGGGGGTVGGAPCQSMGCYSPAPIAWGVSKPCQWSATPPGIPCSSGGAAEQPWRPGALRMAILVHGGVAAGQWEGRQPTQPLWLQRIVLLI